jgi:hypothetical protein
MSTAFNHLVTGNYIGGQAPLCQGNAWTCPLTGDFSGIHASGTDAGPLTISNNIIRNIAMTSSGASTFYGIKIIDGLFNIMNNTVGSETVAGSITYAGTGKVYGLYLTSVNPDNAVENNIFGNWALTASSGSPRVCGISVKEASARKNKILGISAANAALSPTIIGIEIVAMTASTVNEYSNNIISLDAGASTNPIIYGVFNAGWYNTNFKFYYNDFHISGPSTGTSSTYAYYGAVPNVTEFKNNIFSNLRSSGGTGKHYTIYILETPVMTSDYNDFYSVAGPLANYNYTDRSNLAEWKAATGQDAHSLSIDPLYVSSTDLHPQQPLLVAGTPIPGITTDYAGISRASVPTMGAYELTQVSTPAVTQTEAIMIFPVPNDGKFMVSMTSASKENFTITVFNNLGLQIREIRDIQVNGRFEQLIDLRPVDPGIYMVVIRNSEQQIVRKIIVGK